VIHENKFILLKKTVYNYSCRHCYECKINFIEAKKEEDRLREELEFMRHLEGVRRSSGEYKKLIHDINYNKNVALLNLKHKNLTIKKLAEKRISK
jgi:hypothetical protein